MLIKQLPVPCDYSTQNRIQLSEKCFAIVDPEDLPWLSHYDWRCVKSHSRFYAARREVRGGRYHYTRMHRQLMNTPQGMDVHHVNGNTLDNRKLNLSNIEPKLHAQLRFSGGHRGDPPDKEQNKANNTHIQHHAPQPV